MTECSAYEINPFMLAGKTNCEPDTLLPLMKSETATRRKDLCRSINYIRNIRYAYSPSVISAWYEKLNSNYKLPFPNRGIFISEHHSIDYIVLA